MAEITQHRLMIEGWRGIPHSYATVNQFQLLEMLQRKNLNISYREIPYIQSTWKPVTGLFPRDSETQLSQLAAPKPGETFDALYRIAFPFDLQPESNAKRTVVFATSEFGSVPNSWLKSPVSLAQNQSIIVTPSNWSRKGFINSGADESRLHVVPHGVDPAIFHPISESQRIELRRKLGWDGFVFLHVGAMTPNKGVAMLLKSFAINAEKKPDIRLVLKGMDALYQSNANMAKASQSLSQSEQTRIQGRVNYDGRTRSLVEVAELYQAADAYVTPYAAEGFNLPALEAIASGLPILCTSGGATDDFTTEHFARRIDAEDFSTPFAGGGQAHLRKPNFDHLVKLMGEIVDDEPFRAQARHAGPAFVSANFTWKRVVDRLEKILFE
jgi:glycosyltransferase involved in cell wall biosynthesis